MVLEGMGRTHLQPPELLTSPCALSPAMSSVPSSQQKAKKSHLYFVKGATHVLVVGLFYFKQKQFTFIYLLWWGVAMVHMW